MNTKMTYNLSLISNDSKLTISCTEKYMSAEHLKQHILSIAGIQFWGIEWSPIYTFTADGKELHQQMGEIVDTDKKVYLEWD